MFTISSNKERLVVKVEPDQKRRWQEHADEYFTAPHSETDTPGNLSKMVRSYVEKGINLDPDDYQDKTGPTEEDLEQAQRQLDKAKEMLNMSVGNDDRTILSHRFGVEMGDILRDDPTFDELVTELRRRGADEWWSETYSDLQDIPEQLREQLGAQPETFEETVDALLRKMVDDDQVEVIQDDGEVRYTRR